MFVILFIVFARQTIRDKKSVGIGGCGEGWFDIQDQGVCNDYCRWVGIADMNSCGCRGRGSWCKDSYWSCALAGSENAYTDRGKYQEANARTSNTQCLDKVVVFY